MRIELLQRARELYAENPSHAPLGAGCNGGTVCPVLALEVAYSEYIVLLPGGSRLRDFIPALQDLAASAGITDYEGDATARRQVIKWNASSSTEDVLAAFDKAIAWEGRQA